jgi:hypothetical protein
VIRRLLRFAVRGLCLLSLLACLGSAWLWWRSLRVADELEVARAGLFVQAWSAGGDVSVTAVRGWPNPEPPRVRSFPLPFDAEDRARYWGQPSLYLLKFQGGSRAWEWLGLSGDYGWLKTCVNPDGTPLRVTVVEGYATAAGGSAIAWSRPMRYAYAYRFPYAALVAVTAAAPLLWLGTRARRVLVRRRRRSLGLCFRCGYDLRESPGRCPECGTSAPAVR